MPIQVQSIMTSMQSKTVGLARKY